MSKATVRPALGSARRLALILAAALVALAVSPAAQAGPILERTVAALRSDPVYQDSDAQYFLDLTAQTEVRAEIAAKTDHDVYAAMLPAAAVSEDGGLDVFMRQLVARVNPHGTFGILAGNE